MNRKTIVGLMFGGFVVLGLSTLSSVAQAQQGGSMMTAEQMQQMMQQRGYGMGGMGMMGMGRQGMMGGPGMMGMGPGMMGMGGMGMGPIGMLDLTDDQRTQINKIQDDLRKRHWSIMGEIMDEQAKMRDLFAADQPDPKKVGTVYGNMHNLRRQMIESHVEAMNRVQALFTTEQREQLKQWRRGRGAGMMSPGKMPQ